MCIGREQSCVRPICAASKSAGLEGFRGIGSHSSLRARLTYLPGATLIRQGDRGDAVYVILDGNAEVTIQEAQGQRKLRDLGRHAFIGEIAVLETTARTATVTVTGKLEALRIDRDVLFRMVKDTPDLGDRLKAHLAAADYDKD